MSNKSKLSFIDIIAAPPVGKGFATLTVPDLIFIVAFNSFTF